MMMGWGDGGAWQAPRTGRMFGWEKILQADGTRVSTTLSFIHDVHNVSSYIRIWCNLKMPCVKELFFFNLMVQKKGKKGGFQKHLLPSNPDPVVRNAKCQVSRSWKGVAWKFAGLNFRNVDSPCLNWLLSLLSYYGFVYRGGWRFSEFSEFFQHAGATAANHFVIGKTETKLSELSAAQTILKMGRVRITWVSGVPHWSLCSSWWSSPSPAAPSRWSRRLAIDLAITVYRTAGQLNNRADLEKGKKKNSP